MKFSVGQRYYFEREDAPFRESARREFDREETLIAEISESLDGVSFSSSREYADVIKRVISAIERHPIEHIGCPIYSKEISHIKRGAPLTEKATWGGVSIKNVDVENDYIRKLLVVGKSGVLGFEYHKLKREHLRILEGLCLLLYSDHKSSVWKEGRITLKVGRVGDEFDFLPFDEHGIVAVTNSVIEETSTNHLDDIEFVYRLVKVR